MMRDEDDDDSQAEYRQQKSRTRTNPFSWTKRSARRVQLGIRTSITSTVAKRAHFEEDDNNDEFFSVSINPLEENANIDQAMMGLYSLPDQSGALFPTRTTDFRRPVKSSSVYDVTELTHPSSSYIPHDGWDPILDGGYRDPTEEQRSIALTGVISNYETCLDWQNVLSLATDNLLDKDQFHTTASDEENPDHDDGENEFGDFQSAESTSPCASQETTPLTEEGGLSTPPPAHCRPAERDFEDASSTCSASTFSTINTVGLLKRVDDLLITGGDSDDADLYSVLSGGLSSTPMLIAQTNELIARAARERRNELCKRVSGNDSDNDSDVTPTTRAHGAVQSYATPARQLSREFGSFNRISMDLPIQNLTTLEDRWTRRRQLEGVEREPESHVGLEGAAQILEELPELYQLSLDHMDNGRTEANSVLERALNAVPWGCIHLDEDLSVENDLCVWDDFMAGQLSQLDSALEGIQKIMAASVKPEKLEAANNLIHSCDQNLRLAKIYWDRSFHALEAAKAMDSDGSFTGKGALGPTYLLDWWQQKEDFVKLFALLERLEDLMAQEQEITQRIDTFDAKHSLAEVEYHEVVRLGQKLRNTLEGDLAELDCLAELRDSRLTSILEERFWKRLKYLTRQGVIRVCRKEEDSSLEYESIFKAALGLYEASHATVESSETTDHFDEISGWSKHMVEVMSHEAERCFALALLEPLDAADSAFVRDLRILEQEIMSDWGDSAKLKTLTHNLVTIRFEFERSLGYFPRVMECLCDSLLDVLRCHVLFFNVHSSSPYPMEDQNLPSSSPALLHRGSVASGLSEAKTNLWIKCESVLVHALEEYQNFAPKVKMFSESNLGVDDSEWQKEIQGLHVAFCTITCFLQFKSTFLGENIAQDLWLGENRSGVCLAFEEIALSHVRSIHVEAMTCVGRMLSRESWYLTGFNGQEDSEKNCDVPFPSTSLRQVLVSTLESAMDRCKGLEVYFSPNLDGASHRISAEAPFSRLLYGLPAEIVDKENTPIKSVEEEHTETLVHIIEAAIQQNSERSPRIITNSIANGLIEWTARLVLFSLKLPPLADKACAVVENLFDLYFTTAFRVCAGSRRNERIVLGDNSTINSENASDATQSSLRHRPSSPSVIRSFGQERRPRGKPPSVLFRTTAAISSTLDIELCSPTPKEYDAIAGARRFLDRAQRSLHGNVNLNRVDSWIGNGSRHGDPEEYACAVAKSIEKREAAAWSCLVAACLANTVQTKMSQNLPPHYATRLGTFRAYVNDASKNIYVLARKASEVSCARALAPFEFVKEIIEVGGEWEENKLHEHPNDYIENLSERASLIWGYVAAAGKLPPHLLSQIWENLQMASFLTLIEGFSRIIYCSTEGRALMALDLASLSTNFRPDAVLDKLESFDLPFTPPAVCPRYGKQYVDLYVKVYYYPQDDIMGWISKNARDYKMHHMLALISSSGFAGRGDRSQAVFDFVKDLYVSGVEDSV